MLAVHDEFPKPFLLPSEACNCPPKWLDWTYGENYGYDIMGDLNAWAVGWTDWNMLLDMQGGPNHLQGYCDSPMRFNVNNQSLVAQPAFYYMAHFSKFIPPDSVRIECVLDQPVASAMLNATAFLTPNQQVVVVVMNRFDSDVPFKLAYNNAAVELTGLAHSIQTYIFDK